MTKGQYKFIHFTSYLTIVHGILYWVIKEFFQVQSDYGLRPHFFQTYIQAAHILLSPLLVVSFGLLWQQHIVHFFKKKSRKLITGSLVTISLIIIILSGYLIQVIYDQPGKSIMSWVHLIFSGLYLFAYLGHHFLSLKKSSKNKA
jgi:uncharacterized membrane protein